jgi:hypothetical protein
MRSASVYHGNEITMRLLEGAWTSNADYKDGGSFASPISVGCIVKLVTTRSFTVAAATSVSTPIGVVISTPMGTNTPDGRFAAVRLFGRQIEEVELDTASDAIAIGGYVTFQNPGGSYSNGVWTKDATANHTIALEASAASGSIASGSLIAVLFGVDLF